MLIDKAVFSVREAAHLLDCNESAVYRFIHSGRLDAYRDGERCKWHIPEGAITQYRNDRLRERKERK